MATDELSAPLGLGKRRIMRLPFGLIGAGLFSVALTTVVIWMGVVDDPFGGEPTAVIPLENSVVGLAARDIGVVEINPDLDQELGPANKKMAEKGLGPRFEHQDGYVDGDGNLATGQQTGLSITPDPRVSERTDYGFLPNMGVGGVRPLDVYARQVVSEFTSIPKIAIVIGGLGLSKTGTEHALARLPVDVTFAFAPYGTQLDRWMQKARGKGHELLLQLPLEPFDFPDNDPGPQTLLVSLRPAEFIDRLAWLLTRVTNYVGVINYMGARYTSTEPSMQLLMEKLESRGLMYVDDGTSSRSVAQTMAGTTRTPFSKVDVVLDAVPKPDEINARLLQLEAIARARGVAVAAGSALPVTVKQLEEWARDLEERGLLLVPVSATIDRPAS